MQDDPKDLSVRPEEQDAAAAEEEKYYPVTPAVLLPEGPVPFPVYKQVAAGRLRVVIEEGEPVPDSVRAEIQRKDEASRYYVRGDHRQALLRHQEGLLVKALDDERVPVNVKCDLLQSQTELISLALFEKPTGMRIERQRENVKRMVDLVLREPAAMKGLLGLTHHDYYTYTHSVNVGFYALWLMRNLYAGDNNHDLREVTTAFFLHDIGKCRVKASIINKVGNLTPEEWKEIRRHPTYGYQILEQEKSLTPETAIVVLQHHEWMNGQGYPKGLSGDEIHPYARACCMVDAFDALTTNRSYKRAITEFDALRLMRDEVDTHFDREIFRTFVLLFKRGNL